MGDQYQSNHKTQNKATKIRPSEIDGALLEKLGVPLDYNEQTNLATMIMENRKLQQDDDSRFNGHDASGNMVTDIAVDDGPLDAVQSSDVDEKMLEEEDPQIGPD